MSGHADDRQIIILNSLNFKTARLEKRESKGGGSYVGRLESQTVKTTLC